jgi:hypothetical protein
VRALRHPAAGLAPIAAVVVALLVAGPAHAARLHVFSAAYAGTGSGHVSGKTASGSATLRGSGRPIGASTLSGSATGTFTSPSCVVFSGRARLTGRHGTLRLSVQRGQACASGSGGSRVSFFGSARIVGATGDFAGARGTLSFHGSYSRATRAVTVSFGGRIRY